MIYRISIFINTILSLVFIALAIIGVLYSEPIQSATIFVLILILFAYGISLLFDFLCYRTLSLNKEKLPLTGWIKSYGKIIFVFSIFALLCILFLILAASYAFFADMNVLPQNQQAFFIGFLLLLVLSAVSFIFNAVGYFSSIKENKRILNAYVNEIGSS